MIYTAATCAGSFVVLSRPVDSNALLSDSLRSGPMGFWFLRWGAAGELRGAAKKKFSRSGGKGCTQGGGRLSSVTVRRGLGALSGHVLSVTVRQGLGALSGRVSRGPGPKSGLPSDQR